MGDCMKIAIQADGGIEIGMGHIIRTLVLAKELAKKNEVFYICRVENKDNLKHYIKHSINEITSLDENLEYELSFSKYNQGIKKILAAGFGVKIIDENRIIDELRCVKADLLITDSYNINESYFKETKKIFRKTAYIDDTNKYYFNVDILINQNIDAKDFKYNVNNDTNLLLGTEYTLLRDEFRNLQNKNIKNKINDIMITVGGADPYNITDKILNYVKKIDYNFHVVIGPSFCNTSLIENFKTSNLKFYHNADMCEIMKKCDLAISACGSTLYELSACGVPTLGIIIAENQKGIANKLSDMNAIINLGWYYEAINMNLVNNIDKLDNDYILRKSLSEIASKLVDGRGVERIAKVLCEAI